jgi:hypothetical protein
MKKGLLIVAAVLMLAGSLQAGEIKLHQWPCAFVAQQFMTIPVKMDIGYWIRVKGQDGISIKLSQKSGTIHDYSGCTNITVESNFNATLTMSIAQAGSAIPAGQSVGNLSCDFGTTNPTQTATVTPGSTVLQVCAYLSNANLSISAGGTKGVQVGLITIMVAPSAQYTVNL